MVLVEKVESAPFKTLAIVQAGIKLIDHNVSVLYSLQDLAKELSFCHKLWFSNLYIFVTQCRRP